MTTMQYILFLSFIFMIGHVSGWYRGKAFLTREYMKLNKDFKKEVKEFFEDEK